jgi:aldehyde:ferredoxin oxidoreductase
MATYGYMDTILRVDLSSGQIKKDPLPQDMIDEFVGGRGFVAKMLYDELIPGTEPFAEENMVVVATGPLTGTSVPSSGKTHFGTKSPASGGYGDSNMGGHFAPALKYAGYDVLVVTGKAEEASYLYIEDDKVELRSAEKYWGKGSLEVEKDFKDDLGEDFQIITIGPAGENLVRYACISHDFGRQAGRTGVGAVLGSKNIKAIAIKGTGSIPLFDTELLKEKSKETYKAIFAKPGFEGWTPEGTAGITNWVNEVGAFPTRNFKTSYAEHYKDINGKAILENIRVGDKGCFGCPTPCGKYSYTETELGSFYVEGPEYETIAMMGGNCDLKTIEGVAYANYICDELGLDTISAGVAISWLIECYEKGIITEKEIGKEIEFGDLETVDYLIKKISNREGIGDLLADGVEKASQKVGQGSDKFAIHVKGVEWTGYECRNAPGMMLSYMTADIGAHHNRSWVLGDDLADGGNVHDLISSGGTVESIAKSEVEGSASYVIDSQHVRPAFDLYGICRLQFMELGLEPEYYEDLYYAITGNKMTWDDLVDFSEKVWHLTRSISAREIEDFGRKYDYPPERFYTETIPNGPNEGHCFSEEEIDQLLDEYYKARGWDEDGIPTKQTLEEMDLGFVIGDL